MKNFSIKWKIFSFLLLFSGVLLLLLWLFQVVFLDSFYKAVKITEIQKSAALIEKNIGTDGSEDILGSLARNNDLCIELISSTGQNDRTFTVGKGCVLDQLSVFDKLNLLAQAEEKGEAVIKTYDNNKFSISFNENQPYFTGKREPQSITYAKIVDTNDGNRTGILIGSVISPVDATVSTLRTQLYYITGFMILFSILLALIISKKVSTPIEKLNGSAKKLAQGDYDTVFDATGYKEISELSDTMNYTAKELSKVEGLRRELIANISHDLRTPLTLISGYAEVMRDIPQENTPENAQVIINESNRLTSLVNNMLDLSNLQSGNQAPILKKYNLTQSLQEDILRLQQLVKAEGYHIEFEPQDIAMVNADELKISQVVYNLLINAINYTGPDKKVVVRQILKDQKVRIEIEDSGPGIEKEDLPYIWQRYYKAPGNHKRPVTGSGIGLSIVKSILTLHQGSYGVQSEEGRGSCFWFELNLI